MTTSATAPPSPGHLDVGTIETFDQMLDALLRHFGPLLWQRARFLGCEQEEILQTARVAAYECWVRYSDDVARAVATFPSVFVSESVKESRTSSDCPGADVRPSGLYPGELTPWEAERALGALDPVLSAGVVLDVDGSPMRMGELMRGDRPRDLVADGARSLVARAREGLTPEQDLVVRVRYLERYGKDTDQDIADVVEAVLDRPVSRQSVNRWHRTAFEGMRAALHVTVW